MKIKFSKLRLKVKAKHYKKIIKASRASFWFLAGSFLALFFISSFLSFGYKLYYGNKIYPGVYVNGTNFSGKTKEEVKSFFINKNEGIKDKKITLTSDFGIATVSAKEIDLGFDEELSSEQAYSIGRSENPFSNLSIILQAFTSGINLPVSYKFDDRKLDEAIKTLSQKIEIEPTNAVFTFENNRVKEFRESEEGRKIDSEKLHTQITSTMLTIISSNQPTTVKIPIKIVEPEITTEKVNDLGIKELIGEGHSLFYHSIPGRIHNVNLAASRISGILVAPDEVFSFNKALGDVSSFTGYQQAYVIQNGKTVLGDGGGVCQVSTTFFRALLNAGLPIVERHPHAYRVGYYEQDSPPGLDATIFTPTVDLKFKNDTGHYILIQSSIDLNNLSLAFYLYGTSDGRTVSLTTPIVSNQTPPPPPLYQDDPNLPKGEIKQTDFEAWGANVSFQRTVTRNNKTIISETFISNYRPWQAAFLRGTKE